MYNVIEDCDDYSRNLCFFQYYRDKPTLNFINNIVDFDDTNTTNSIKFEKKITIQTDNNSKRQS